MGDIETSATAAIKIRLADTDLLSQYINERDKEPIWDGFIYAYKNKYKKNDDLIGRAPVQVKGKTVKRFSKKNPKYKVSITNLEKYRNDGGVLYFVVHIDADKNKKIYYAALQPFLINQYLRIAQSKKPISINLKELPDKPNDFENIVINFIEESQKQSILKTGKNWTIEEVEKLLGRDNMRMNCHFTCIGYDRNDPFLYLKNNELYLHIQNPDGTLSFPVEHLESVESVITERSINVYSNGHKYYDLVKVERHKDETLTLYFGKSFKYIWERDKQTLKYALTGNLDERLQDLRFIIDVFDTKCLTVNGLDLPVSPTKKEIESFDIEGARVTLKYYELIKEMLDILHVSIPLDMDKLTEKQEDYVLQSDYSEVIVVGAGADAVDYKLISICHKGDIVVSQDYGVAAMALGKGAYAIHQSGKWYTNDNIDQMLMERHLNKKARRASGKNHVKGPKKRTPEDDEHFSESFEKMIRMAIQNRKGEKNGKE